MTVITKPRLMAAVLAIGTVAAMNRFEQGRKLLGTDSSSGFFPWS